MTDRPAVPRYEACGILVASTPLTVDAPTQITLLFETPQQLVRAEDYDALDAERQRVAERLRGVESNRDAEYALMDEAIKQRDEALALVKELGRIQPEIQARLERDGPLMRALVSVDGTWTEYASVDISDIETLTSERDEALARVKELEQSVCVADEHGIRHRLQCEMCETLDWQLDEALVKLAQIEPAYRQYRKDAMEFHARMMRAEQRVAELEKELAAMTKNFLEA